MRLVLVLLVVWILVFTLMFLLDSRANFAELCDTVNGTLRGTQCVQWPLA